MRLAALSVCMLLMSCADSSTVSTRRLANETDKFSLDVPDGWSSETVRGLMQFATDAPNLEKHTVVIRSAVRPAELSDGVASTQRELESATKKVLLAMPEAELGSSATLIDAKLSGVRFSMTFAPKGLARRYRREHVLLVGSHHVYHVIYTSPAEQAIDEASFKTMYSTLAEGA